MTNWKRYALVAVIALAAGVTDIKASDLKPVSAGLVPVSAPVSVNNGAVGASVHPVEWVSISGGKFMMGTDEGTSGFENAYPVREVNIKTFEMSKTPVTVEQYGECVAKGRCEELDMGGIHCKWGVSGQRLHPVTCVSWDQANQYAGFKGARLPSESEWEYAARSGGKDQKYPWGNEAATCDKAGGHGCGGGGTMSVCSTPAGNTAQGL